MILLYRIAPERHAADLTGEGARRYGGRWNKKGTAVMYTSESRSLAVLESLVHVSLPNLPADLKIITIRIPDGIAPREIDRSRLPLDWRGNPPPFTLAEWGSAWAALGESLLLRVPSAVLPDEYNVLINPQHPDSARMQVVEIADFAYDKRLYA